MSSTPRALVAALVLASLVSLALQANWVQGSGEERSAVFGGSSSSSSPTPPPPPPPESRESTSAGRATGDSLRAADSTDSAAASADSADSRSSKWWSPGAEAGALSRAEFCREMGSVWRSVRGAASGAGARGGRRPGVESAARGGSIQSWLAQCPPGSATPASDPDGAGLQAFLDSKVRRARCGARVSPREAVCALGCDAEEPELDRQMRLLRLRRTPLQLLWRWCKDKTVDALVWVDELGEPRAMACARRGNGEIGSALAGATIWKAKLKVLSLMACSMRLPNVLYAFGNSDYAVPDERRGTEVLYPAPGIVRYVGTPATQSLLWPTGQFVEATTHLLIHLSDEWRTFSRVARDMDEPKPLADIARPWEQREPTAFWRGSMTYSGGPDEVRFLPRINVVERFLARRDRFNVSLMDTLGTGKSVDGKLGADLAAVYRASQQTKMSPRHYCRHKMLMHMDGNTAAWGLALKMSTNSLLLWVESLNGYREFYYEHVRPWKHYVPVSLDLADLDNQVECIATDAVADGLAKDTAADARELLRTRLRPAATYCYQLRLLLALEQAMEEPPTRQNMLNAGIPVDKFESIRFLAEMRGTPAGS